MRIVFLVNRYWPSVGGVERYVAALAAALVGRGHEVTVVAGAHAPGLPASELHEGVAIRRFPAMRSPARCWAALLGMRRVFSEADIVHLCDTQMLDYYGRMVGWLMPARPVFMTMHGMSCVYPVPDGEKRRAARARSLVAGLIHDGAFIGKWLDVTPDVIAPQGLSPKADALPRMPEPAQPSACYVGRLAEDMGVSLYLDAVRILRDEYDCTLPLHVYGAGPLEAELRRTSDAQILPVTFHGHVPNAQDRLAEHTLALVSGRMAIHEALARRRAVVAAYCNPIRRDYVETEAFSPFIATGGDGATLAAQVYRLLTDADARRDVVERGFEHVRPLSWDRTADAYLALWTSPRADHGGASGWTARARLAWRLWREASGDVEGRSAARTDVDTAGPKAGTARPTLGASLHGVDLTSQRPKAGKARPASGRFCLGCSRPTGDS